MVPVDGVAHTPTSLVAQIKTWVLSRPGVGVKNDTNELIYEIEADSET